MKIFIDKENTYRYWDTLIFFFSKDLYAGLNPENKVKSINMGDFK